MEEIMKYIASILCFVAVLVCAEPKQADAGVLDFLRSAVSAGGDVDMVKNGYLELDKSTTVGNALDNYSYFQSVEWKSFETEQKRIIVQFAGELDQVKMAQKNLSPDDFQMLLNEKNSSFYSENWKLLIQFRVLPENKFDVGYIGIEGGTGTGTEEKMALKTLADIYENKSIALPQVVRAAWMTCLAPIKAEAAIKAAHNAGFIAMSGKRMSWADANAWCQQQGGKLPLIGGRSSIGSIIEESYYSSKIVVDQGTPIDGFGTIGGPWPSGLLDNEYWTNTKVPTVISNGMELLWFIRSSNGTVNASFSSPNATYWAICVP